MKFHKHVGMEARELLREQLKKYEQEQQMTKEERIELRKWVAAGNSPYENGDYVYGENGWLLDFVRASRTVAEIREWFLCLSREEQQKEMGLIYPNHESEQDICESEKYLIKFPFIPDEELPFK